LLIAWPQASLLSAMSGRPKDTTVYQYRRYFPGTLASPKPPPPTSPNNWARSAATHH
jgi:hypothetical protein